MIFITKQKQSFGGKTYHYTDDSLKANDLIFEGQRVCSKYDPVLQDPTIPIKVFRRSSKDKDFVYIGDVVAKELIHARQPDKNVNLLVKFRLEKAENPPSIPSPNSDGDGRFKLPVFRAYNVQPLLRKYIPGIIPVRAL